VLRSKNAALYLFFSPGGALSALTELLPEPGGFPFESYRSDASLRFHCFRYVLPPRRLSGKRKELVHPDFGNDAPRGDPGEIGHLGSRADRVFGRLTQVRTLITHRVNAVRAKDINVAMTNVAADVLSSRATTT
jgi:hypothetical protein